jgi:hypothetical protein
VADELFKGIYFQSVRTLLLPSGYRLRGDVFHREHDRLIHAIGLEHFPRGDFTAHFAVLPLVCFRERIGYGFGARVSDLRPDTRRFWEIPDPTNAYQIVETIANFTSVVTSHVLSWLERFHRPIDLVIADQTNTWNLSRLGFATPNRKWFELGFCALAESEWEIGHDYLERSRRGFTSNWVAAGRAIPEPIQAEIALLESYLDLLRQRDYNTILVRLADTVARSRRALGLDAAAE